MKNIIEKVLDHDNFKSTIKYHSNYRKHSHEPVEEPKNNATEFSESKDQQSITDSRTALTHVFKTRLRLNQHDFILAKEKSMLTRTMSSFEGEKNSGVRRTNQTRLML